MKPYKDDLVYLRQLYLQTLVTNPYYVLSADLKLTQQEVADATKLSTEYIYRLERGLVNSPSIPVIDYLLESSDFDTDFGNSAEFIEDYWNWVASMRELTRDVIYAYPNVKYFNYENNKRSVSPFEEFMAGINKACLFAFGIKGDSNSRKLFARFILINPRTIELYVKNIPDMMPPPLVEALEQVGIYRGTILEIEKRMVKYKKWRDKI